MSQILHGDIHDCGIVLVLQQRRVPRHIEFHRRSADDRGRIVWTISHVANPFIIQKHTHNDESRATK